MMRIERHPIEINPACREILDSATERVESCVQAGRRDIFYLKLIVGGGGLTAARFGSLLEPASTATARVLVATAQAHTAFFACPRPDAEAQPVAIGDGPPVVYADPAPCDKLSGFNYEFAATFSLISRRRDCLDLLLGVPTELLLGGVPDAEDVQQRGELWRAICSGEPATASAAYAWWRADVAGATTKSAIDVELREFRGPLLDTLPPLDAGDGPGFGAALLAALQRHRKFWGGTAKRREDNKGWISFPLTAVAALAWDRGMRFDVESDYIPTPWVRGDMFRT